MPTCWRSRRLGQVALAGLGLAPKEVSHWGSRVSCATQAHHGMDLVQGSSMLLQGGLHVGLAQGDMRLSFGPAFSHLAIRLLYGPVRGLAISLPHVGSG